MATIAATRLRYENIKPKIGARILNTKEDLLSGELSEEILPCLPFRSCPFPLPMSVAT